MAAGGGVGAVGLLLWTMRRAQMLPISLRRKMVAACSHGSPCAAAPLETCQGSQINASINFNLLYNT